MRLPSMPPGKLRSAITLAAAVSALAAPACSRPPAPAVRHEVIADAGKAARSDGAHDGSRAVQPGNAAASSQADTRCPRPSRNDPQVVERVYLHGFEDDHCDDPVIRRMKDGSLYVVFDFMPPRFFSEHAKDPQELGPYESFGREMQQAIGVDVVWEDREFFLVRSPRTDTIPKIQAFLAGYRDRARPRQGR